MKGAIAAGLVVYLCIAALPGGAPLGAKSRNESWPLAELRQYTLRPGQAPVLAELFEREFIESQEAVGMKIVGQFRDVDKPDRFVWIRAFKDMADRAKGLTAFYNGPTWKAHREAANATMLDSGNVLLLREAEPGWGFPVSARMRAPRGTATAPSVLIVATIYYFSAPVDHSLVQFFANDLRPRLTAAGFPVLASYITETSANNFPRLPIRENEHVFAWFSRFADASDYEQRRRALEASPEWQRVAAALERKLAAPPEVIRLHPTPRSELRD